MTAESDAFLWGEQGSELLISMSKVRASQVIEFARLFDADPTGLATIDVVPR